MTTLEKCQKCGKKQFNPSSKKCYACRYEIDENGIEVIVPNNYNTDKFGNLRTPNKYLIENGKLFVSYHYLLESGKITLRGEYGKFRNDCDCEFPERLDCNYGECYQRCKNMVFVSLGNWKCTYNKNK